MIVVDRLFCTVNVAVSASVAPLASETNWVMVWVPSGTVVVSQAWAKPGAGVLVPPAKSYGETDAVCIGDPVIAGLSSQ